MEITLIGDKTLQEVLNRIQGKLRPDGLLGDIVRWAVDQLDFYAEGITPVDTGSWQASHRTACTGLEGRVFVDPTAVNVRTGVAVISYAGAYESQGGAYAVYRRTILEAGPRVGAESIERLIGGLSHVQ